MPEWKIRDDTSQDTGQAPESLATSGVGEAELLDALCQLAGLTDDTYSGPGAFTVPEMARASHRGTDTVAQLINAKIESGEIVQVTKLKANSIGRFYRAPAYVDKRVYDEWRKEQNV